VHRDLAARNILLTNDLHAKICDFGYSRRLEKSEAYTEQDSGPIRWMAPECLFPSKNGKRIYSYFADVWMFGILLHEIFSRKIPYANLAVTEVVLGLGNNKLKPTIPSNLPEISVLMEKCFDIEPHNRPLFAEICTTLSNITPDMLCSIPPEGII